MPLTPGGFEMVSLLKPCTISDRSRVPNIKYSGSICTPSKLQIRQDPFGPPGGGSRFPLDCCVYRWAEFWSPSVTVCLLVIQSGFSHETSSTLVFVSLVFVESLFVVLLQNLEPSRTPQMVPEVLKVKQKP